MNYKVKLKLWIPQYFLYNFYSEEVMIRFSLSRKRNHKKTYQERFNRS
ncbi:hypothetical protein DDD_0313 [Nonlabens dokdonensis DSW-6]|uniref:Uncharacterized protein n=1 Tax=Nonlabens dokdonensis (strain DSM 17205 / KCTC 12402 / DSW-6) TaxID=592029 RepID=L7W1T3_NONDD|nr:hypothetical protein DDD_0313 [Nonlabens dokdonensis DSW-6]